MRMRTMLMATVAFQVATASPATANATDPAAPEMQTTVDADGTIHTPPLSIPPSEYWSDTFRSTYAAMAARMVNIRDYKQPEPTAPKSDWDAFDDRCRQGSAPMLAWQKQNYPVEIRETFLAGVHAAILKPKGGVSPANKNRVLIELHGGSCGGLDGLTEGIPVAHFGKITVVVVDYRAAPRYAYPASIEDVGAVYLALLKTHRPKQIAIFGTSGGGMLTAQTLAWLQRKGAPVPGAAGIFWSGLTDHPYPFGKFGDSILWELGGIARADHSNYRRLITQLSGYMSAVKPDDPVGYPGSSEATLARFPPTLLLTGTRAVDMSAVVTSHAKLVRLGVDASLYVMEGGWHAASYGTRGSPEEVDVNTYIGRWFDRHLAR